MEPAAGDADDTEPEPDAVAVDAMEYGDGAVPPPVADTSGLMAAAAAAAAVAGAATLLPPPLDDAGAPYAVAAAATAAVACRATWSATARAERARERVLVRANVARAATRASEWRRE